MTKKVRTVVFPVAGLGTRFLPATKATPKEMLPVASKPLIQHAFEEARDAGIDRFIFIIGRNKNSLVNHFDHAYELQKILDEKNKKDLLEQTKGWLPKAGHIAFVRQQYAMGLGHAILCAKNFVGDEPFVVINADELIYKRNFTKDMIKLYEEKGGKCNIVAVADVPENEVSSYGIIDPKSDDGTVVEIQDMVEKPKLEDAPSRTSLTGRYLFEPEIFDYIERIQPGAGGEYQITDAMKDMIKSSRFFGLRFKEDRFDCGRLMGYLEANIAYSLLDKKIEKDVKEMIKKYYEKLFK